MADRYRIAFVTTHPIQYQVPVFRKLAAMADVDLIVYFCQIPDAERQGDGFGVAFEWDLPLLEGYEYEVLNNVAAEPSLTRFSGCDTPEIAEKIRDGQFDAVIVNGWVVKSCVQAIRACRKHGVACIVRGESNAMRPRAWWKRMIHRQLLRQFDAFLTIGTSNAAFYKAHGVTDDRMFPARYCVDNERFAKQAADLAPQREQLRESWGVDPEDTVFLFCGKFIEKKHPMGLLEAVASMKQRGVAGFRVLMVGDGELRSACERYVAEHDLPVTFVGFLNQSELSKAYVGSDCLVLPSDHGETWGLVVNEAMASGRPAIVSDQVGCSIDLIIEGATGAVFPFGDWEALGRQMAQYVDEPQRLTQMGRHAQQHIAEYSIDAAAEGIRDALRFVSRNRQRTVTTVEAVS